MAKRRKSIPATERLDKMSNQTLIQHLKKHRTVTEAAIELKIGRGQLYDRCTWADKSDLSLQQAYRNLRKRGIALRAKVKAGEISNVQKSNYVKKGPRAKPQKSGELNLKKVSFSKQPKAAIAKMPKKLVDNKARELAKALREVLPTSALNALAKELIFG